VAGGVAELEAAEEMELKFDTAANRLEVGDVRVCTIILVISVTFA
jgi:hypothetical protein